MRGTGVLALVCIDALNLFSIYCLGFGVYDIWAADFHGALQPPAWLGGVTESGRCEVATGEAVAVVRGLRQR